MAYPYKKGVGNNEVDVYGLWFHSQHCMMKNSCHLKGCAKVREGTSHMQSCSMRGCEVVACQVAEQISRAVWSAYISTMFIQPSCLPKSSAEQPVGIERAARPFDILPASTSSITAPANSTVEDDGPVYSIATSPGPSAFVPVRRRTSKPKTENTTGSAMSNL